MTPYTFAYSNQDKDKAEPNTTLGHGSPLPGNVPSSNQQQQPSMFQWPYPIQNAPQAPWQQLPHPQQGTQVFWPPQMLGWQAPPPVPGATSATNQNLVPNMYYSVGYPFPSFSGPWDPSSNLAQMHQLQHSHVLNSVEAQSKENAKLWSMVNKLQAEVSDYKARLTILEQEVSSLKKDKMEGQPRKRGRPAKLSPINSLWVSQPLAHGKKPAPIKTQFESKSPIFEKVILKKVDHKEIPVRYARYIGNTAGTPSQYPARHVLDATHQQGGNVTPGSNFADEKDPSEEEENGTLGSIEDEMVDDDDDTGFST
ncbi:hypothetical protein MTR_5g014750 [Medicago truncatula]|uniref:Uncharacterized protein n=2 Tax=Medicago truncatula TaxID=3880 RepID=G7K143_MEDTR|nr:hypothetical protein MTR_5g014750 [Medicago truncatula]